jgi:hypothetical protein
MTGITGINTNLLSKPVISLDDGIILTHGTLKLLAKESNSKETIRQHCALEPPGRAPVGMQRLYDPSLRTILCRAFRFSRIPDLSQGKDKQVQPMNVTFRLAWDSWLLCDLYTNSKACTFSPAVISWRVILLWFD